jgi:hypothetical protein
VRFHVTSSRPEKTLVRCHVLGPDGRLLPTYARNILLAGKAGAFVFPSAVNDAPGIYTVRVSDVITGATQEAKLELQ